MSFRFYQQPDHMDCGHTCLRIVARYHGRSMAQIVPAIPHFRDEFEYHVTNREKVKDPKHFAREPFRRARVMA